MPEVIESSAEKMSRCTELAFKLAYSELDPSGSLFTPRDNECLGDLNEEVWCWADGLYQKWYHDCMDGRCSLQATIDFDTEEQDKYMDDLIEKFEELLKEVGEPITLTPEEMTRRGYKGY